MADDGESLESWLNKATNPSNRQEDWECIMGFCDQMNKELEGPKISARLLVHKIQSPQEWEALQALMVLEACMKNCGWRFHNEVGKFRFLNELIKVVSPKYLGDQVSDTVKSKVIEMLYSWTVSLPNEAKICEAYQMLKTQGIVSADPEIPLDATFIQSPPPQPKNPVFDDEEKSKRLAVLLRSKKPEDLQEANLLIQNMVKEDEVRTQKASKQISTLESVTNSVKVLNEMLAHFSTEDSTEGDKEIIRELYADCDKLRQTVWDLATEAEDNDSSLGNILQASDDLSYTINSYKKIVEGQTINGETHETKPSHSQDCSTNMSEILIDLVGLHNQSPSSLELQSQMSSLCSPAVLLSRSAATNTRSFDTKTPSATVVLLDEELLTLGLNGPVSAVNTSIKPAQNSGQDFHLLDSPLPPVSAFSVFTTSPTIGSPVPASTQTTSIATSITSEHLLSAVFPDKTSSSKPQPSSTEVEASQSALSSLSPNIQDIAQLDLGSPQDTCDLKDIGSLLGKGVPGRVSSSAAKSQRCDSPQFHSLSPNPSMIQASQGKGQEVSLANLFVPLEAIRPSKVCPVTAYDKNGVRVLLHFASDCPAGRPDVLVMVASMINTAPLYVRNIAMQAAVPKSMKVRLQPPSGKELAPFNPLLPPATITQVMLLANPLKENVRMRYKLIFILGDQLHTELGEINEFPPADIWGTL